MKTKTIKDLAERINDAVGEHEFAKEKSDSLLILACDDEGAMHKIVGHHNIVAAAIAEAMMFDENLRDIIITALVFHKEMILMREEENIEKAVKDKHTTKTNQRFS